MRARDDSVHDLARYLRQYRESAGLTSGADGDSAPRSAQGSELRLEILGPLAVWRDGSPVALGGTRQRAVLGVLALHNADGVHRDTIVDLLWGEDPPPSAVAHRPLADKPASTTARA